MFSSPSSLSSNPANLAEFRRFCEAGMTAKLTDIARCGAHFR
jgi:hypothetical protein